MAEKKRYVLASVDVLPEVFIKVLSAKQFIADGSAQTSAQACRMAELSRSAYYKYKDEIKLYEEQGDEGIITYSLRLKDETGVLSAVLSAFAKYGANVLTVNQNIPSDRVAYVTIAARILQEGKTPEGLLKKLLKIQGVLHCKSL